MWSTVYTLVLLPPLYLGRDITVKPYLMTSRTYNIPIK